ncbi:hypothetical protein BJ138DRAFT_304232 [Hygrophoropsis aurantiaca]|uniref:Uncharacterized protein n=1 Tax=Hygrophoropsis aurantiaca TaxID=72124 RepID=A0ACB8A858_9AGAM|nr:hypothetical protein BJ138DRAFT_304232 [Hygrophoropsis aurantiaca]
MTSYLRYIFGGNHHQNSSAPAQEPTSKAHGRSRSAPTQVPNYIYGPPSSVGSTTPHLKTKRSNSYCARTAAPSPLRYATMNSAAAHAAGSNPSAHSKYDSPPLYRRASYKASEHGTAPYPLPTPSATFGTSSRTNSSSSLLPGMAQRPPSSSGSSNHLRYTEVRPSLRHNNTWQSSVSSATGSAHSYAGVDPHQARPAALHMHPLFAATRLHSAPISYDITYTPSSRTVLDRTTHSAVPAHTLSQPATDPPTPSSSRIVLRSDKFPWPVVVGPSSSSSGSSFYVGSSPSKSSRSAITNLDLLYALHTTLLTRVTPQEWEALGHGSRAQRKATRAYEKRCTKMGGGWEGGVRRVDWLHGKTRLIGIEVEKHGSAGGSGKLVFGKA